MLICHTRRTLSSSLTQPILTYHYLSPLQLNHLLQQCCNAKVLNPGRQTHLQIIQRGSSRDPFMITKLIQFYAECNLFPSAVNLFDQLPQPNIFAYTAILSYYSKHNLFEKCISSYSEMKLKGVSPDKYVFPKILRACGQLVWLKAGIMIHKDVIMSGDECNAHVCNALIDMYSKCRDVRSSQAVFESMVGRDLLSWNSMISGYVSNGYWELGVKLFDDMEKEGVESDLITWNTVLDAYCRMEMCDASWKLFERMSERNIISWTTLISGYSRIGKHDISLRIFGEMISSQCLPDLDALSSALASCRHLGALQHGRQIHGYGVKLDTGNAFYKSCGAASLTMYAKCKRKRNALNVYELMDKFDVVSWNAMINGLVDLGLEQEALDFFCNMQKTGIGSDETSLSIVLPVSDLQSGKQIHALMWKRNFDSVQVLNALIYMYSKCGCIEDAHSVFHSMDNRDIVSWNTVIGGLGMHGHGHAAIKILRELKHSGVQPNYVTFASSLSACSHSGLVNEGVKLFYSMTSDFGLTPQMEHCACIVDLLSRAGQLEEAVDFIQKMPIKPDKSIWGALLAASREHQNVTVGKLAAEHLFILEPEHAGHYVTLSNIYAKSGKWEDAVNVRKLMEGRGLLKPSGHSWIGSQN